MNHVWLNPKSCKLDWLKKEISIKLTNAYKQDWLNDVNEKSSCNSYKTFKTDIRLEKYLLLPDSADRINMSKFRCRNSKIPVVTLRYRDTRTLYEDRICPSCNIGAIGDEFH